MFSFQTEHASKFVPEFCILLIFNLSKILVHFSGASIKLNLTNI